MKEKTIKNLSHHGCFLLLNTLSHGLMMSDLDDQKWGIGIQTNQLF